MKRIACTTLACLALAGCPADSGETAHGPLADAAGDTGPAADVPSADSLADAAADASPEVVPLDAGDGPVDAPVPSDAPGDTGSPADAAADTGADAGDVALPPPCPDGGYDGSYLLPGRCEAGFDAPLEAKARGYDRVWHALNASATGLNADVAVSLDATEARAAVEAFAAGDGWDFEAATGMAPLDVVTSHGKTAGLYAGVGVATDAMRYGVLRDQGYPEGEVDVARAHLLAGLDGLHVAVAITGVPGVIARGTIRTDLPGGQGITTTPLFDEEGSPLPPEKSNGTWREDNSGLYPTYVWEDSVSRDQYLGWATAFAAAWEVIRDDATIPAEARDRLKADALAVGKELMVVRETGYDLEIPDADGRTTLHGYLHENNIEGVYLPNPINGLHAVMALGFVASWVYVTDDADLRAWLEESLLQDRDLPGIVKVYLPGIWAGKKTNYSNTNMAFGSIWLAQRYLEDEAALAVLREALDASLYAIPGEPNQPEILAQSLFDFVYAGGMAGQSAHHPAAGPLDLAALARGAGTLHEFPAAPYWDHAVAQCPAASCDCDAPTLAEPACTATDGTALTLAGCVGHNCDLVATTPLPLGLRPPSNYHWRSNPFKVNGGGSGANLLPGIDLRFAYWSARWTRVAD